MGVGGGSLGDNAVQRDVSCTRHFTLSSYVQYTFLFSAMKTEIWSYVEYISVTIPSSLKYQLTPTLSPNPGLALSAGETTNILGYTKGKSLVVLFPKNIYVSYVGNSQHR